MMKQSICVLVGLAATGFASAFQGSIPFENSHLTRKSSSSARSNSPFSRKALTLPLLLPHEEGNVVMADDRSFVNGGDWLSCACRNLEEQVAQCWSDVEEWGVEAATRLKEALPFWNDPEGNLASSMATGIETAVTKTADKASSSALFHLMDPTAYELTQSGFVGAITGLLVVAFKLSIEAVRSLFYEQDFLASHHSLLPLIPALGGAMVGLLLLSGGSFAPGLKGIVQQVDQEEQQQHPELSSSKNSIWDHLKVQADALRKSAAAIATLGTGCSLGPEGPCVEIGLNVARACTQLNKPITQSALDAQPDDESPDQNWKPVRGWNRILLSSGAAAGVAAGFNAPIAGVFFALEIMQKAFSSIDKDEPTTAERTTTTDKLSPNLSSLLPMTAPNNIAPILLASVISALISQNFLGDHLALCFTHIDLKTPLLELPLYLILGGLSGVVAAAFSESSKVSQQFFAGDFGLPQVRRFMSELPDAAKPVIGGLLCGLVGLVFPQILFFGYEAMNSLLKNNALPMNLALSLLVSKSVMTAVSVGSGLVGGTFALALFLGAMLGTAFQNGSVHLADTILNWSYASTTTWHLDAMTMGAFTPMMHQLQQHAIPGALEIGSVPAYAMVGAASTLAALFRAPLTASLLLFEVTRNYDAILPLLASAGVASIVGELLEERFAAKQPAVEVMTTFTRPRAFRVAQHPLLEEDDCYWVEQEPVHDCPRDGVALERQ
ncbi:Chloride channel protein CLC-e [Seminavis robusta]|uniref:Chloride channel protein CLC-e n=1 Tax=Seminavis robusta TaxID=568900 RepID=A0A9N8DJ76_9STRA|nr:Chloride channel protein CLC-e [Seminavis robusta]|eukprot:Sro114_g056240.1 Chloride channel protein CLC-e (723) ;mRNA; r:17730-19898